MELAGRVALVTGGSGDLGTAICAALARRKVDVAVAYIEQRDRADRVVAGVESLCGRAMAIQIDQSDVSSAGPPDAVRETALQRAVLRRGTSAADVAEQVVTFCSTDSTTGQVLAVDAGFVFH